MENRLICSFVVLSALFFLSSAQCPACPISSRIVHWDFICTLVSFSRLPFLQRNCAWSLFFFFLLSFFFHFGRVFLVSELNCGWHLRALAKPSFRRQVFMAGYVHNEAFQYSDQVCAQYCSPSMLEYFHFSRKLLYLFSWPFVRPVWYSVTCRAGSLISAHNFPPWPRLTSHVSWCKMRFLFGSPFQSV